MIARHSNEQSQGGDGVEVVVNRECTEDEEKYIHLKFLLNQCCIWGHKSIFYWEQFNPYILALFLR